MSDPIRPQPQTTQAPDGRPLARRLAFGLGSAAVVAGVCLNLPMFIGAASDHYKLAGMAMDAWMLAGMSAVGLGLAAVAFGLTPARAQRAAGPPERTIVRALDDAKIGRAHVGLLVVLTVAIAIDAAKPFTFAFILPGVAKEYGLSSPAHVVAGALPVALLAFMGIAGTVIGSLLWGHVADRLGRRGAILMAALIFVGTATCGAMPEFRYNLTMCFVMGLGAGGLLPVSYALLAEVIPARSRGALMVLVAGLGTGLGFVMTAAVSSWLMPTFGWRIMWFLGLPTGLVLILANRFIPESPRWLIEHGRAHDAAAVMARFGVQVLAPEEAHKPTLTPGVLTAAGTPATLPGLRSASGLGPLTGITLALVVYGGGWGVVNFGFLTWLPTDAAKAGISVAHVSGILTNAALFSLPGALIVSWCYWRFSTKATMVAVAALTAASLVGFALAGPGVMAHSDVFIALLVCLLVSMWGVISVLAPYAAEVYPTRIRAGGGGVVAGASKLGGVAALGMAVAGVAPPGLAGSAAMTAAVMATGALGVACWGVETRRRGLEDIVSASSDVAVLAR